MTVTVDSITDRESYLAWRADWRRRYAAASERVRDAKRQLVAVFADRRAGVRAPEGRSWDFVVNSINERMPDIRRDAHRVMAERADGVWMRDEILGRHEPVAEAA